MILFDTGPVVASAIKDDNETYADFPLGTTDTSVIALAERLRITEIVTLDHGHFAAVRPAHCKALTLPP